MAVTKITELSPIVTLTNDDLFIVNDGVSSTNSMTFANLAANVIDRVESSALTFTNVIEVTTQATLGGVLSITADTTFTGTVGGIALSELDDTNIGAVTEGQVLSWDDSAQRWVPATVSALPGSGNVSSVNGLDGTVVLDADDIDDTTTDHRFVSSAQLLLIDGALQTGDNISVLINDANYVASGDNISVLTNDAGYLTSNAVDSVNGSTGAVVLDADDIDDTSTTHKFATAVQLGLAETAVQPGDSVGVLADVDLASTAPVEGDCLVYDGTNWVPGGPSTAWDVTPQTGEYNFSGVGFSGSESNPTIYVSRGQKYYFRVSAAGHPFQIQSTTGTSGTLYNDGVTNNGEDDGVIVWEVRMDAPSELYYQCSIHSAMNGIFTVR